MFKKMALLGITLLAVVFASTACESNLPGIAEIEEDLKSQLYVARVDCFPGDTLVVGEATQCVAFNPTGAEISFEGYPFTIGGWSISPDSLGAVTIQGTAAGKAPGVITVRADGYGGTFATKSLVIVP